MAGVNALEDPHPNIRLKQAQWIDSVILYVGSVIRSLVLYLVLTERRNLESTTGLSMRY
jgi:hypothetical protein